MAPAKTKIAKACKAMKKLGYSGETVKPILTNLLKLYGNKWKLIEEGNYRVLVEAVLDSEEQKAQSDKLEQPIDWSEDEDVDNEPLSKRSKRNRHENPSSPLLHSSIPSSSDIVGNQPPISKRMAETTYDDHLDKDAKLKAPCSSKSFHEKGKGKTSSSPLSYRAVEQTKQSKSLYDLESDESNSSLPSALPANGGDDSDSCHVVSEKRLITCKDLVLNSEDELPDYEVPPDLILPDSPKLLTLGSSSGKCSNAKGNCSMFPEVVDLYSEDTSHSLPKVASSVGNSSDSEGNQSESMNYEQSKAEKNETGDRDMKLDIASSSKGEVKITLIFKSSLKSGFKVPNLEEVLKQVEDTIPQTGFSMQRLMNDICECFLAAGTISTHTESGNSKDTNSHTVSDEGLDRQLSLYDESINLDGPKKFDGVLEVSPEISRCLRSMELELSREGCNGMARKDLELNNLLPSSSRNMVVPKQQCHYIKDITKGHEFHEISLINEINNEPDPTFGYISKNVVYQNAYLKFLLACISEEKCCSKCFGDCLSLEIPCACASETGGEFAYAPGGFLAEKFLESCISMNYSAQERNLLYCQDCPLKKSNVNSLSDTCEGHVVRKFIKECWYKCGCSMKCGNRVVQQGIRVKLQVFMTPDQRGWGLRTLEVVPKGAFICEYAGEVVTTTELFQRNVQNYGGKHTHSVVLDADWKYEGILKDEKALCLDATGYGNVARFINHRYLFDVQIRNLCTLLLILSKTCGRSIFCTIITIFE
ncbi:hypothetical protein RD792_009643, partial [Penstemon davidsonii]